MLDDAAVNEKLGEQFLVFCILFLIGSLTVHLAWRRGFFKSFQPSIFPVVKGKEVLLGFGLFLFAEILFVPLLVQLFYKMSGKGSLFNGGLDEVTRGWLSCLIILGGFLSVMVTYYLISVDRRKMILQQNPGLFFKNVGIGLIGWFIAFPWVMAFNQIISSLLLYMTRQPAIEQPMVKFLRLQLDHPLLFFVTTIGIVILVPFTEEFLFRGLLQSWLKTRLKSATCAVIISSMLFASIHFSISQGLSNIELILTLFPFSCFLGFLYEKQCSLWTTVTLHAFFNLISITFIFAELS